MSSQKSTLSLKIKDLKLIQNDAVKGFESVPEYARLSGMNRQLDEGEKIALGFIHSVIQHLNRIGALKEGFDGRVDYEIPDSRTGG